MGIRERPADQRSRSQLIPNLPQQALPPLDFSVALDSLGREAVHHAQDAAALLGFGEDHFGRIGRRAEDAAHLRHHLDRVQHVYREEALAQEDDEGVAGGDGLRILRASSIMAGSVPDQRTRHLPDASQNASPNLMPGTAPTRASWRSSTDLMKCVCPRMKLIASGLSILTVESCMGSSYVLDQGRPPDRFGFLPMIYRSRPQFIHPARPADVTKALNLGARPGYDCEGIMKIGFVLQATARPG